MPALSTMQYGGRFRQPHPRLSESPRRGLSEEVCISRCRVHWAVGVGQDNDPLSRLFEKMSIRLLLISAFTSSIASHSPSISCRV